MKYLTMMSMIAVLLATAGCANQGQTTQTKQGAVTGAAVGAIAGGIIGHQKGRGLEGAAIGAGAGAVGGGVLGSAQDEKATGK